MIDQWLEEQISLLESWIEAARARLEDLEDRLHMLRALRADLENDEDAVEVAA